MKLVLIVVGSIGVLAVGVIMYLKQFAQPLDKTGMAFDFASVLNGEWISQNGDEYFVIQNRKICLLDFEGKELYSSSFTLEPDSEKRFGDSCYLIVDEEARLTTVDLYLYYDNRNDQIIRSSLADSVTQEIVYQRRAQ